MDNKKKILFYSATAPTVMLSKIAKVFQEYGYYTILYTMCENDKIDYDFYNKTFDKIVSSNFQFFRPSIKSVPYLMLRGPYFLRFLLYMKFSKPYAVIGVCGNNWQLRIVHKYLLKKIPFIYFPYDILSHFYKSKEEALKAGVKDFEIESEKYCFENSDLIMHKGAPYELKYVEGRIFDKINFSPDINFQPYCSDDYKIPLNKNKLSKKDNELHIVYTGFLANNPESKKIFLDYFESLLKQKIHLHIYTLVSHIPKEDEKKYIDDFFSSIINEKYLHIHEALDAKNLITEISKYDFSIWLSYETNLNNVEQVYGSGNKISTYLEAGLPILYNEKSVYLGKLLDKYGIGIRFTSKNLKTIKKRLKKLDYIKFENNILKSRDKFDMNYNFPRLEKMIKKVVEIKNKK
ncbi:MAG: hypothetical protein Q8N99_01560 [Nanoarchaeota archaeon]|nr:hypothetical protein [Nanoarchaeota archaeon]